jgi:hypothetical protein
MAYFQPSDYKNYHLNALNKRWFRPEDLIAFFEQLGALKNWRRTLLGNSFLGKPIHAYHFGDGPTRILIWSQMHGNEPTATHALLEMIAFIEKNDFPTQLSNWSKELSICVIPMLNPDGAALFTRENAQGIDMNRDAVARQTPEMQAFFDFVASWKPQWAFNLHDQRTIFNCAGSERPATISFLAPSANPDRKRTPEQQLGIGLIDKLTTYIRPFIRGHQARFTDEYYPKALGEYFMRNEIPCVLIESGPFYDDPYRTMARKLNFLCLMESFNQLSTLLKADEEEAYFDLPKNAKHNVDILYRNAEISMDGKVFQADVALLQQEKPNFEMNKLEYTYVIEGIGDLSHLNGLKTMENVQIEASEGSFRKGEKANLRVTQVGKFTYYRAGRLLQ